MMKKSAQPSQYQYPGYETSMDHMGYLPGVAPEPPPEKNNWLLPVGLAAGSLAGYSLLRGAGRGLKGLASKLRSRGKDIAGKELPPVNWNWDMEMLGRDASRKYQSFANPGKTVGHGYGPAAEDIVKHSSAESFATIIAQLGTVARNG